VSQLRKEFEAKTAEHELFAAKKREPYQCTLQLGGRIAAPSSARKKRLLPRTARSILSLHLF
jgi:hypothetical protein